MILVAFSNFNDYMILSLNAFMSQILSLAVSFDTRKAHNPNESAMTGAWGEADSVTLPGNREKLTFFFRDIWKNDPRRVEEKGVFFCFVFVFWLACLS